MAVITWDEAPVIRNIGLLVKVSGPCGCDLMQGLTWRITPVSFEAGHLFIDGRDGNAVKVIRPDDIDIFHPDAWMRPVVDPDEVEVGIVEEVEVC